MDLKWFFRLLVYQNVSGHWFFERNLFLKEIYFFVLFLHWFLQERWSSLDVETMIDTLIFGDPVGFSCFQNKWISASYSFKGKEHHVMSLMTRLVEMLPNCGGSSGFHRVPMFCESDMSRSYCLANILRMVWAGSVAKVTCTRVNHSFIFTIDFWHYGPSFSCERTFVSLSRIRVYTGQAIPNITLTEAKVFSSLSTCWWFRQLSTNQSIPHVFAALKTNHRWLWHYLLHVWISVNKLLPKVSNSAGYRPKSWMVWNWKNYSLFSLVIPHHFLNCNFSGDCQNFHKLYIYRKFSVSKYMCT